jgi:hypothetical protein
VNVQPSRRAVALALASAAAFRPARAGTADPALAVIAAAKAAMGGAAWDRIAGWHERGRHGAVSYETWLDFRRYGARYASTRDGVTRVNGFNGRVVWDQASDGKVTISRDAGRLAEARQSAYASSFAFFLTRRFQAGFEYLGGQAEAGASFDVVRVTPEGATPIEVWVDRSTHLLNRFVDRSGAKPVTVRASDYRPVGAIRQPFRLDISDGDPAHDETGFVDSVVLEPVARGLFDPPR